jgi:DNA transposition AAA+ family ATPase
VISRLQVDMATIVIDEADFLIRSTPALLETVRDITDMTGCACILVGMDGFPAKVAKHQHIASRVARIVELKPLSPEDVATVCEQLCEVKLSAAVVAEVHKQTGAKMRLILNAISNLEQWANANGWREVQAEHIKGKALVVEFRSAELGRRQEAL